MFYELIDLTTKLIKFLASPSNGTQNAQKTGPKNAPMQDRTTDLQFTRLTLYH